MVAGRGLGHTGGTVDKIESFPSKKIKNKKKFYKNNI